MPLRSSQKTQHTYRAYLPADHETFPWPGVFLGLGIVLSPAYWCASQAILQRSLAAKSQWDASAGMMFAAFAKTMIPLLVVFPGLLALVMHADIGNPDQALAWVIKNVLPPGLSGLMFIAIIAALQSSIDSGINSTSLMITRDIRHVLFTKVDEAKDLRVGRYVSLVLILLAMCVAPLISQMGGIYTFIQTLLSLFQGPMLALLIMGAFTRFATPTAGLWTLITGVLFALALSYVGWLMLYVAFASFIYALIAIVVISKFTKPRSHEELDMLTYMPWRFGRKHDADTAGANP